MSEGQRIKMIAADPEDRARLVPPPIPTIAGVTGRRDSVLRWALMVPYGFLWAVIANCIVLWLFGKLEPVYVINIFVGVVIPIVFIKQGSSLLINRRKAAKILLLVYFIIEAFSTFINTLFVTGILKSVGLTIDPSAFYVIPVHIASAYVGYKLTVWRVEYKIGQKRG